jgi:hypothetical protein
LAEEFEDQVVFIGVSNNDTVEDGRAYQDEFGVPYTLAHGPEVWTAYGDPFRPTTIVIDGNGGIVTEITGPVTYESLKEVLDKVT